MRARLCCLTLAIGLMPAAASAQDGLRSASLPERRLGTTPREDVFRARPWTYRPDPHRKLVPFGHRFLGPQLLYPAIQPIIVVVEREPLESTRVAPPPPAPVTPPTPYVAGLAGPPKTFYVIPGCYAGDRPPEPKSLKSDCSISRLRVVPPRP
jgi:hypothetical protein